MKLLPYLAAACVVCGCKGDSRGGGGTSSGGKAYELKSLDQDCYGLTGKEVIAAASSSYPAASFTYGSAEPNAGASTPLAITVSYAGGKIVCNPPTSSGVSGPSTIAHVTVDVTATFRTTDGAFDETLAGTLDAFDPNQATFDAIVARAALHGSYDPGTIYANAKLDFGGEMTRNTTRGNIVKAVQTSASSAQASFVGTW